VYRVLYESMARSRLEATSSAGWTPLVGREQEIGVLLERWAQVKDGFGQVVLLNGEAGIGKSRLVQVLTDQVAAEPRAWLTPGQAFPGAGVPLPPTIRPFTAGGPSGRGWRGVSPGGGPGNRSSATGGVRGAVWPATGAGGAPVCRPPLPAAAGGLCARDDVA